MSEPSFEELARQRHLLQEFCKHHIPSVSFFRQGISFKLTRNEMNFAEDKARHLTSTATCYESIERCPEPYFPDLVDNKPRPDFAAMGREFAERSIQLEIPPNPPHEIDPFKEKDEGKEGWRSDGSARIYCRCRALPYVVSRLPKWDLKLHSHLRTIFYQLGRKAGRLAIGEADQWTTEQDWYPPNAYHTYWALETLSAIETRPEFKPDYEIISGELKLSDSVQTMHEWAKQRVGVQVALHASDSSVLDSDQLAWSLAIVLRNPTDFQSRLSQQDFIRQAFRSLFSTQTKVGTWRHYAPLFHYKHTGNAYCYVFETFATILREALRPEAEFVRTVLKGHFEQLALLWQYAISTQIPLIPYHGIQPDDAPLGWSSAHRLNEIDPESWATASVFAYLQAFRQLVGIWTREAALSSLRHFEPYSSRRQAEDVLNTRFTSWHDGAGNLADRFWSMFVNPTRLAPVRHRNDPDVQPIQSDFPRSAIFFGPPGTSKTTLAKAIAGAIGWRYVEIHASDFVALGLPEVQRTADAIFRRLTELDHAVVLFDEVDELVRERGNAADAFGRFLTTSMLPKLAELWKQRKLIYFVATNHIDYFDRAITRAERFDAVVFISPPSFETKTKQLSKLLRERYGISTPIEFQVSKADIDAAMPTEICNDGQRGDSEETTEAKILDPKHMLAKFALLRWDELGELAFHLRGQMDGIISVAVLRTALSKINDAGWRALSEYCSYLKAGRYERRDFTKLSVWTIQGFDETGPLPAQVREIKKSDGRKSDYALVAAVTDPMDIVMTNFQVLRCSPGEVKLIRKPQDAPK